MALLMCRAKALHLVLVAVLTTFLAACAATGQVSTVPSYGTAAPVSGDLLESAPPEELPTSITAPRVGMSSELYPGGLVSSSGSKVNPPDDRPAWLVETNLPGVNSLGTAIIAGHNYASGGEVPFSKLAELVVGDEVFLGTASDSLRYQVTEIVKIPKGDYRSRSDVRENVPGRLILVTCDTENGHDTTDNFVVFTQLSM